MSVRPVILLVEDDPNRCELVRCILQERGYTVLTRTNGLQALAILGSIIPTLILYDLLAPGPTGGEFALAYHQLRGPHAPILEFSDSPASDRGAALLSALTGVVKQSGTPGPTLVVD
ncbi:MAG: response regulator [Chloroflexi bacterium]|nr:response regulator [Chloroflexota bacterium]